MADAPGAPPRILVDVDVVLDVLARREPFFADSAALLAACEIGRCRGMVAAHTITTLHYLLAKHGNAVRACAHIADLLRIVKVARVDSRVIQQALAANAPDFEDAVQMAAAAAAGAECVVTRNLSHFAGSPLPALRPAELLSLLAP